jgi:hypothetical protein
MSVSMKEERERILRMVGKGTISAEEGSRLLAAIKPPERPRSLKGLDAGPRGRWLRVRVLNMVTGKTKVNVNLPMGLVSMGLKFGAQFAPELADLDMGELLAAIEEGAQGKILEVEDARDGERVEIFIE